MVVFSRILIPLSDERGIMEMFVTVSSVRSKTGLNQEEFAEKFGISLRTLQNWKQGRSSPTESSKTLLLLIFHFPKEMHEMVSFIATGTSR